MAAARQLAHHPAAFLRQCKNRRTQVVSVRAASARTVEFAFAGGHVKIVRRPAFATRPHAGPPPGAAISGDDLAAAGHEPLQLSGVSGARILPSYMMSIRLHVISASGQYVRRNQHRVLLGKLLIQLPHRANLIAGSRPMVGFVPK